MRHRTGLLLILAGLFLAAMTTVLVIRIANQAQEASRSAIRQVNVVVTTRDILDKTLITADALTVRAFPADFAPAEAVGSIDAAVNKFANGFIPRDQVVVARQLLPTVPSPNLSDRVPPGKVAIWLPMPPLLAQANILKPGDRIDILLSLGLGASSNSGGSGGSGGGSGNGLSTQTTLQNVEVFRLGNEEVKPNQSDNLSLSGQYAATPRTNAVPAPTPQSKEGAQAKPQASGGVIGFLVDHQDAVMIKFIKDSGGTIDLVLRSVEEEQIVRTDAVTQDVLVERFRFRVPQSAVQAQGPPQ